MLLLPSTRAARRDTVGSRIVSSVDSWLDGPMPNTSWSTPASAHFWQPSRIWSGVPNWPAYRADDNYQRMYIDVKSQAESEPHRDRYLALDAVTEKR